MVVHTLSISTTFLCYNLWWCRHLVQRKEGDLIKVLALGRYADSPAMDKGTETVIYFAKAQKSKKVDQASALWIYSDSYVHVIRAGASLLPCRREIVLQEA